MTDVLEQALYEHQNGPQYVVEMEQRHFSFFEYQTALKGSAWWEQGEIKDIHPLVYTALKLAGEAGEVAEKIGKLYRDHDGKLDDLITFQLMKELGDVMWYINKMAEILGHDFVDVATINIAKVQDRLKRGVVHGNGDDR